MTVLFVAGFLTGGPRDPDPATDRAALEPVEVVSDRSIETGAEPTGREGLPDLRVGFRRLSGPPVGADAGIRRSGPGGGEWPG
jgi:hypothetical protein